MWLGPCRRAFCRSQCRRRIRASYSQVIHRSSGPLRNPKNSRHLSRTFSTGAGSAHGHQGPEGTAAGGWRSEASTLRFVPAVLVALPVVFWAETGLAQPVSDECRTKPGATAQAGTRWYYRVNPTNKQRCWFLASDAVMVRSSGRDVTSPSRTPQRNAVAATHATAVQIRPTPAARVKTALAHEPSAQGASTEPPFDDHARAIDFAARWPDPPNPIDSNARQATMMGYADTEPQPDAPKQMLWAGAGSMMAFRPALLAGAVVTILLLAGAIFAARRHRFFRHVDRRTAEGRRPRQVHPDFIGTRSASSRRSESSVWKSAAPTDPAQDLKASLRELMGDLQRAGAARAPLRSFAPRAAVSARMG
jgi:hypothetical protein